MTPDDGITTTEEFKDALRLAKINCERSLENAPAPTDKNGKNTFKSNWKRDCLVEINHVVLLIRFKNRLQWLMQTDFTVPLVVRISQT